MSDYMFKLESHLSGEQARAVAAVSNAAEAENLNLFLTGGAMRDMMGGFPIRDLDFTIEGPAVKFAKNVAQSSGAEVLSVDELRKAVDLRFSGNVPVSISMSRQEKYSKPAVKPQIQPSTIHEDLRCRDFTVNAIALSLGKASRGLLLDPTNGLGDLEHKELRTISNYTLYDDPIRLFRLIRLRKRLGFTVTERTMNQYANVREAKLESKISPAALEAELRQIALDPLAGDILKSLEQEDLLSAISPALTGSKLNLAGFAKLHKAITSTSFGLPIPSEASYTIFISILFEKLSPRERAQIVTALGIDKAVMEAVSKLDGRAAKFEKDLAAARFNKPSAAYAMLSKVPSEILLSILMRSNQRIVLDRIKNYLGKYLPTAQAITERDVIDQGGEPGTAKFIKLQQQLIAARLDARPKKVLVEAVPPPPPPGPNRRSVSSFGR